MSFTNSNFVKEELDNIAKIHKKIVKEMPKFFTMTTANKLEHINLLDQLLEKQQILYTRLTLSDDPDAIKMKDQMVESAKLLGFGSPPNISMIFSSMRNTIDNLKKTARSIEN